MTLNSVREEASTYDQLAAHWQAGAACATIAGVILGTITAVQSLGRKSTFIEAVQHTLQHVRDSLD